MKTRLAALADLGQSIWVDDIRRDTLGDGTLARWIAQGVRGLTSNPTIFEQAIATSEVYDDAIRRHEGARSESDDLITVTESLMMEDVVAACDLFRPVYEATGGTDGYVSLEVDPRLAHDTAGTLRAAERLWAAVGRPNLMIKVPATPAGLPALRHLIATGVNVNMTLLFSRERYRAVVETYLAGLEDRRAAGLPLDTVASVASFFVSRVDTLVDQRLETLAAVRPAERAALLALRGRAAVANARLAYQVFREVVESPRYRQLAAHGARPQRPLWASTSTKNPAYPDLLYVETLIGPDTVNTVPPGTLAAILDHARAIRTVDTEVDRCQADLAALEAVGIDLSDVTATLERDGVAKFQESFRHLLDVVANKRARLSATP
jgi:transaldolase